MGQRLPTSCVLLVTLLVTAPSLSSGQPLGTSDGYYDPCADTVQVTKGDTFVFGISYWPGHTVPNWGPAYNASSGEMGLNPCIGNAILNGVALNYTKWLGDRGAVLTSYAITVDKLSVLRVTRAEFEQLWDHIPSTQPQVMSLIAFRGQNRSEARYAASNEPYLTQGVGIATQMALVLLWDKGNLVGWEWFDFQMCQTCGGIWDDRCLRLLYDPIYQQYAQTTCGAPFADCSCRGLQCTSNCTTAIYVGHRGTDKQGSTMQTAYQIMKLNEYSVTSWLSKLWQKVDSAYDNTGGLLDNGNDMVSVSIGS